MSPRHVDLLQGVSFGYINIRLLLLIINMALEHLTHSVDVGAPCFTQLQSVPLFPPKIIESNQGRRLFRLIAQWHLSLSWDIPRSGFLFLANLVQILLCSQIMKYSLDYCPTGKEVTVYEQHDLWVLQEVPLFHLTKRALLPYFHYWTKMSLRGISLRCNMQAVFK